MGTKIAKVVKGGRDGNRTQQYDSK